MKYSIYNLYHSASSSKAIYISIGIFILLYITIMSFYILPPKATSTTMTLFNLQWYIPLILFIPVFVPKAFSLLDKAIKIEKWNIICYIVLVICCIAQLLHIPGLWWSWMTIGLSFAILTLVINITRKRISSGDGFLLGCGVVLLIISIWEMGVYQLGLLIFHGQIAFGDESVRIPNFIKILSWNVLWTLQGIGIIKIIMMKNHKEKLTSLNSAVKICIALFIVFTTTIYINQFPTVWHNPEFNWTMCIIRGSKAFFALSLVAPFIFITTRTKATFYDDQLNSPNLIRSWFHRTRHKTIEKLVLKYYNSKKQIVDLGCGNCNWNENLKLSVIGIDKDKETINYSIKQSRIKTGIITDLTNTTLAQNSIDIIVCTETLEHMPDYKATLLEIKRILKPNGYLILSVPYDTINSLWKPLFWLQCLYQGYIVKDKYYKEKCGHINHFSPKSINEIVLQADFDIIEIFSPHRMTIFMVARKKL